jgi:hypothetical protein
MSDATPTHAPTFLILSFANFYGTPIRVTKHPVHGRMMMAKDVVEAIGYKVKTYTGHTLSGLKVAHENRFDLKREDFDTSERKRIPTFKNATFLAREGLDQLVAGAAAKKVVMFRPWMDDVMANGIGTKKPVPAVNPYAAVEGTPWE